MGDRASFKVLLLGESGTGKSCLLLRYIDGTYTETFIDSIGVDYKTKELTVDGTSVSLQIWDPNTKQDDVTSTFYRGAAGVFVLYDITKQESFDYVKEIYDAVQRFGSGDVIAYLVGTKSDLEEDRQVSAAAAQAFADEVGIYHTTISAKDNEKVEEVFTKLSSDIVEQKKKQQASVVQEGTKKKSKKDKEKCLIQ